MIVTNADVRLTSALLIINHQAGNKQQKKEKKKNHINKFAEDQHIVLNRHLIYLAKCVFQSHLRDQQEQFLLSL